MKTKVAVVILNWNGSEMLKKFLPGLIACSQMDGVEIIVADNDSKDDSMKMMQESFPDIRTIVLESNFGFAKGYNQALRRVDAEYYILLNSDVEVTDGWLVPLISYMDAHPEVAACQPKLRSYRERDCFEYAGAAGGYMDAWGYMYCRGRVMDSIEKDNGQYDDIAQVFWATGAALMVRSADYWAIDGLDDRFFAHQEEIDLCWRLRSRNRRIVCIPESVVYHVGAATLKRENPYKTFLNFRNNLLMLYKNLPEERLNRVMRVRALLDFIAAMQFVAKFKFKDAGAVFRARREFRRLKPQFAADRKDNLDECSVKIIPEQGNFLLIWRYYVCRQHTFQSLFNCDAQG
ncbi:MAG: glycosyltransferase family 2 protein [Bacteroidaceae bacterium]|nr:glycosyltransferase family 2 protein [Bacteroidaceae bacterium]